VLHRVATMGSQDRGSAARMIVLNERSLIIAPIAVALDHLVQIWDMKSLKLWSSEYLIFRRSVSAFMIATSDAI
jgi:hypothetical protein